MEGFDQWIAGPSGPRIASRIFLPHDHAAPHPVIILATGLGSVKENRTASFVEPFSKAGYACVTFDYATWGESEGNPRHLVNPAHQYRDVCNVVAWTREYAAFDSGKIVIWGSSFGGLHVTRLLAEDHDIAAGITQCPCVDTQLAARMKPITTTLQLSFWALCDALGSLIGLRTIYVRVARMPDDDIGGPALMEADGVAEGYGHVVKSSRALLKNRVAARSGLSMRSYQPRLLADKIIAPLLMVLPEFDNVAPLDAAKQMGTVIADVEMLTVPGGHFDLYEGKAGFAANIEAQLAFLRKRVPVKVHAVL